MFLLQGEIIHCQEYYSKNYRKDVISVSDWLKKFLERLESLVADLRKPDIKPPKETVVLVNDAKKEVVEITEKIEKELKELVISKKGLGFIKKWEGEELQVYKDVAGLDTIGVGHLLTKEELHSGKIYINGQKVKYHNGLTSKQSLDLLDQDVDRFERAVNRLVVVPLVQHQFDCLVSFSFNVGSGALERSTLLKLLNQGKYEEVPKQLLRWNRAGGKVVRGLTYRRQDEADLWSNANY